MDTVLAIERLFSGVRMAKHILCKKVYKMDAIYDELFWFKKTKFLNVFFVKMSRVYITIPDHMLAGYQQS